MTDKELRILDKHLAPFIPDKKERKALEKAIQKEIVEMYLDHDDGWQEIVIRGRLLEEARKT